MIEKCKYPSCHQEAKKTWALVPLCPLHYQGIYDETVRYYHGKNDLRVKQDERKIYSEVEHLTPWGRKKN